ncbi:XdhC family protein [Streptacidiphilus monticola]|uniref:XdhC family protein n=1 Tax=Streptacidiphilus monticola TaxID=2161674 RepID=A0ABW1FZP7_9ACTN
MQDIAEQLYRWHAAGRTFAVATVVAVSGSAPRDPGAALAVDADGEALGSVSGGCVEGAVYELCQEALRTGEAGLHRFGYSDEDAFAVGLTCGGVIDVYVQPVLPGADPGLDAALTYLDSRTPVALVRRLSGPARALAVTADAVHGSLEQWEREVTAEARAMLDAGRTGMLTLPCAPELPFFVESYAPAPRLVVFGAIDFAGAVARIGKFLGFDVTVCDARPVFATPRRFPDADRVVVDWPHRYLDAEVAAGRVDGRTALCVLTHDPKFDIPLLERALRLPLGFVGAMGSRRTHADRMARLREAGLTEVELHRLRSPIGLDLGARTPEETAVSVAAEIVSTVRGGSCLPLSAHDGPIHHDHDLRSTRSHAPAREGAATRRIA